MNSIIGTLGFWMNCTLHIYRDEKGLTRVRGIRDRHVQFDMPIDPKHFGSEPYPEFAPELFPLLGSGSFSISPSNHESAVFQPPELYQFQVPLLKAHLELLANCSAEVTHIITIRHKVWKDALVLIGEGSKHTILIVLPLQFLEGFSYLKRRVFTSHIAPYIALTLLRSELPDGPTDLGFTVNGDELYIKHADSYFVLRGKPKRIPPKRILHPPKFKLTLPSETDLWPFAEKPEVAIKAENLWYHHYEAGIHYYAVFPAH